LGLEESLFTKKDVKENPDQVMKKLDTLVPLFNQRVEEDFQKIRGHANTVKSIDLKEFYSRLKIVFNCFLERPNYWEIASIDMKEKGNPRQSMPHINSDHASNWMRI
ncbi:MAG: hypothetical protein ACOC5T_10160, partial [Elusimicrobiota bacterium]